MPGNFIPARIGHRVFLGHWVETLYFDAKLEMVQRFYGTTMTNVERQTLLADCGCRFVFYGPDEQSLGQFQPSAASFLRPVYDQSGVVIYAVTQGEAIP